METVSSIHMWNDWNKLSADQLTFHYEGNELMGMDGIDENENAIDYISSLITNLEKYKARLEDFYGYKRSLKIRNSTLKIKLTYIYLMFDENTGLFKIGRSLNPEYRERTLQSQAPKILKLFTSCLTYGAKEKELHRHFANKRVRGEWFSLNENDIEFIRNYDYEINKNG